ncbi:mucin-2-like [Anoplophora glabripennis]|uniref:mucin-2-like n=1 Tax=Anoplophora glabripennis TaxID=217634 RepID=UPI00087399E7|nr:mucin-2-like [Anoplophora glabripennis]
MANFKVFLLVCGVIAGVCGSGDKLDPEPLHTSPLIPPQPTSTPTSTTPPPTSTTSATTPKTTTTAQPTTPSTTTTSKPTSTTPKPTSTTPKPTSTTPKPTTPTPTPTPAPGPVDPKVANWTVNYANSNRSCIILFVATQFEILDSNKTKVNVPVDATASGSCEGKDVQTLTVSWGQNNSLELDFEKNNSNKFDLNRIVSTLNVSINSVPKVYKLFHQKTEFSTPLENSYKCAHQQTLNLTEENSNVTVAYLHVSHLQYQAFRNSTEHKFDSGSTKNVITFILNESNSGCNIYMDFYL